MEDTTHGEVSTKRDVLLPASIIIAGVLIAGAVIWSVGKSAENPRLAGGLNAPSGPDISLMRAVDGSDHIKGSRDAEIVIVEYSDFECPFCKVFQETMREAQTFYGTNVAWVYRQYPIEEIHKKAHKEAEASECAAELGGNDAFWRFADRIFEVTPSNDGLDLGLLPDIAEYAGISRSAFESCLASGRHANAVVASVAEAEAMGVGGTPFVVFVSRGDVDEGDFAFLDEINQQFALRYPGQPLPFSVDEDNGRVGMSGAFPLELIKEIVKTLLE